MTRAAETARERMTFFSALLSVMEIIEEFPADDDRKSQVKAHDQQAREKRGAKETLKGLLP